MGRCLSRPDGSGVSIASGKRVNGGGHAAQRDDRLSLSNQSSNEPSSLPHMDLQGGSGRGGGRGRPLIDHHHGGSKKSSAAGARSAAAVASGRGGYELERYNGGPANHNQMFVPMPMPGPDFFRDGARGGRQPQPYHMTPSSSSGRNGGDFDAHHGGALGGFHQQATGQGHVGSRSSSFGGPYNQQGALGVGARMGRHHLGDRIEKVLAVYDYNNMVSGDVCFAKGDIMELLDDSNQDWWYVMHSKNGVGYAPRNFLARIESMESEEWYVGKVQRSLAEKLVCAGGLPRGTFLVRKRENGGEYAITINDSRPLDDAFEVKHYKIRGLDNGQGFYITTKKVFPTIRDLVAFYTKEPGGLCCRLTVAAPKMAPVRPDLSYDTAKNWEIPREELTLVRKLGDGNFGEVWLSRWRKTVEVAVKMMKPGMMPVNAFLREAHIMKSLNHPKLVKLYAVCTIGEPYYIVTEYMVNGSLFHYLRSEEHRVGGVPLHALVDMCGQIANGMMYLESRKLVHRDLAARNVLVGEVISCVPEVKVADFGLARNLHDENIYAAHTGAKFPIKWTAPEAAQYGNFTVKSDVWSFGILVYEIFTLGHTPYPGLQNREVIEQLNLGYRMPCPPGCPDPVYGEMLKCWDEEPSRRPTFEYLFGFFDDYFVNCQSNYQPPSIDGIGLAMDR